MSRRSLNATVVLGALAICACSVYGPDDLIGSDTFGSGGHGGLLQGGSSGAGLSGGRGGTGTGGNLAGGSGGKSTGGVAGNSDGGAAPTGGKGSTGGSAPTGGKGGSTGGEDTGGSLGTGGSGGSVSTGGSSGGATGGGATTTGGEATGGSPPLAPELIDNMEDGNQNILINGERDGAWYTAAGVGGTADPAPNKAFPMAEIVGTPGVADSTRAIHFSGSGGTQWGVMVAFDFHAAAMPKVVYDASAYKGITFWIKATSGSKVTVRIPIKDTTEEAGGRCVTMTNGCENHFATALTFSGTGWKQVTLLWAAFAQDPSWGFKTTFAPTQLVSVQFVIPSAVAPATPPTADFWIDDIAFVP